MTTYLSLAVIFHVMGLFSSVHAILGTRTSQGAIAWTISLNTMPYVAVPAYWVLGRSRFQGYVSRRRDADGDLARLVDEINTRAAAFEALEVDVSDAPAGVAAETLAGMPYLRGNAVELLIDGEATFNDIMRGIDAAEEYILFQFFIVKDDGIGREIQGRLIERARAGVRVYFLYDEIGSNKLSKSYIQELKDAGAYVLPFNTRKGLSNRFQLNFRNHRKIVVVDGKSGWVGGHNVGDEYLGLDPEFGHWRDTHMRIDGPAALELQFSFVEDWYWAAEEIAEVNWDPVPSPNADIPVLIVPTGPADLLESAALMFIHAINTAQERIWIASPYFIPDDAVMAALQVAGLRGVDVRIIIPDKPDHLAVYLAAYTFVEPSSRTGVKFYRYMDGFLHQKVMLIDDRVATVGTANFDNRSFRLNFEVTGVVVDSAFAAEVETMLEEDLANSVAMPPEALANKPFWFRLAAAIARLTAPVQ